MDNRAAFWTAVIVAVGVIVERIVDKIIVARRERDKLLAAEALAAKVETVVTKVSAVATNVQRVEVATNSIVETNRKLATAEGVARGANEERARADVREEKKQ